MLMMATESDEHEAIYLLQAFLSFDAPKGFRIELLDGEIVVTPPLNSHHGEIIGLIAEQVFAKSTVRMNFNPEQGLIVPTRGITETGRVIPDGTFAPAELRLFRGNESWLPAEGVALVVEVTSSHPERDREAKRRAYADAGIPLYLLVDRQEELVILFGRPEGNDYRRATNAPFGEKLELPKPFGFTLDTAPFDE